MPHCDVGQSGVHMTVCMTVLHYESDIFREFDNNCTTGIIRRSGRIIEDA